MAEDLEFLGTAYGLQSPLFLLAVNLVVCADEMSEVNSRCTSATSPERNFIVENPSLPAMV